MLRVSGDPIALVPRLKAAVAWTLRRSVASMLFGITPEDRATFAGVMILLSAVALLAAYIPARRAARIDPAVALRSE